MVAYIVRPDLYQVFVHSNMFIHDEDLCKMKNNTYTMYMCSALEQQLTLQCVSRKFGQHVQHWTASQPGETTIGTFQSRQQFRYVEKELVSFLIVTNLTLLFLKNFKNRVFVCLYIDTYFQNTTILSGFIFRNSTFYFPILGYRIIVSVL